MARLDTFTLRINESEQRLLASLAAHLQRSRSDTVRFVIRETARKCGLLNTPPATPGQEERMENAEPTQNL